MLCKLQKTELTNLLVYTVSYYSYNSLPSEPFVCLSEVKHTTHFIHLAYSYYHIQIIKYSRAIHWLLFFNLNWYIVSIAFYWGPKTWYKSLTHQRHICFFTALAPFLLSLPKRWKIIFFFNLFSLGTYWPNQLGEDFMTYNNIIFIITFWSN